MRRKPYTQIGISRMPCVRDCGRRATTQWQVCADGRQFRPLCAECDVELNRLVLEWAGFPDAEEKMIAYERERLRVA